MKHALLASLAVQLALAALVASHPNVNELYSLADHGKAPGQQGEPAPADTCGYSSCPRTDPERLNVHIVAHTHDDVGWLKTVDQYFYGTKKRHSPMGVQHIIDSLIPQLMMDRSKRFVYVEMSFFAKWWREQEEPMRAAVRKLVNEGRLEFINGGWCMNDEATVTYQSTIEQMSLGLRFLNETFGACGHPKVGWQIDPFGHTNEQASLFAQFGFDGMFFTRISSDDKANRTESKSLDLIWHGDRALSGQSGSIFTNIFRDGYDSPTGFCFDVFCLDDELVDNKASYEYNIDSKTQTFLDYLRKYAQAKATNHLLVPFGGDFHFSSAGQNFKAIDKLIRQVRASARDINIFYSTPSCYQLAVHQTTKQKSMKLPEKYDDFMPYASSSSVWWSGYFTSRPSVKVVEREVSELLPVTRFVSLANLLRLQGGRSWSSEVQEHESRCLLPLWEVLGDLQHHDAVTGTEKQHVANDYVRRSSDATRACAKFIGDLRRSKLNEYLKRSPKFDQLRDIGRQYKLDNVYLEGTMFCPLLNISQCDALESEVDISSYMPADSKISQLVGHSPAANPRLVARSVMAQTKSFRSLPHELATKSVLLNVYNPLDRPVTQHDVRLPCNWRCDLDKVKVIHLSTNETMKLTRLPVPSGVECMPFRDAQTNYEILFYANIPPLGYTSFVIEDTNDEAVIDEENDMSDSVVITDESASSKAKSTLKSRRLKREEPQFEFMEIDVGQAGESGRTRRDSSQAQQNQPDRVIVKFEMNTGMIVGLKRLKDGSVLNITQKFGYYFPANANAQPGAYIFRPNSSDPILFDKPMAYKMYKRKNGALIEIHQKWSDWIWQTIRVDAKKNYIEFDYVVGSIPTAGNVGREVVSRYITSVANKGVFLTDSNGRQLLPRHRLRDKEPEQLGGSFFPVVSTIMLRDIGDAAKAQKNSVDAVAVLVDRAQAGTSLHDGQLELLVHRRHLRDDHWGVEEALDEPGEDGRGLVTRGKHRLYLKFREDQDTGELNSSWQYKSQLFELPATPRSNLHYERQRAAGATNRRNQTQAITTRTYLVHDHLYNELRQESVKLAMRPVMTFDRLRVSANDFIEMIASAGSKVKTDLTLINITLPSNVNLLTLQPWAQKNNSILIRLENLDNPLLVHPFPDVESYQNLLSYYRSTSDFHEAGLSDDGCVDKMRPNVDVDIEYLIKKIRFVSLEELRLGANVKLSEDKRLNWTDEVSQLESCDSRPKPTSVKLAPRQIRTFLANFEFL